MHKGKGGYENSERVPGVTRQDGSFRMEEIRLRSSDLFAKCRVVVIEHDGEEYRLRLTSKGKLILTK